MEDWDFHMLIDAGNHVPDLSFHIHNSDPMASSASLVWSVRPDLDGCRLLDVLLCNEGMAVDRNPRCYLRLGLWVVVHSYDVVSR